MPDVWLWISGLFFVVGIVAFVAMSVVLFKVLKVLEDLHPKLDALMVQVQATSKKVDDLVVTAQSTVRTVSTRADNVTGVLANVVGAGMKRFETGSTVLAAVATVVQIFKAFQAMKKK